MTEPEPTPVFRSPDGHGRALTGFPWIQLFFCIACLAMAGWTWLRFSYCWDVKPEMAQKFAARMGGTAVKTYDGMVGKVDGILFGGLYEVPWHHKLARPYIEAGIPVYLSRPFAFSLRDIDDILELAAKHNTPIMATAKFVSLRPDRFPGF